MDVKKLDYSISAKGIEASTDFNQDGEKSLTLKLNFLEAFGEAFKKGEAVEGVAKFSVKKEGDKVVFAVDTDQDGENMLELEASIGESIEEAIDEVTDED